MKQNLFNYRLFLGYGAAFGSLFALIAWAKYYFLIVGHATEIYVLLVALIFTGVGVWAGLRWSAPRIIEKPRIVEVPVVQSVGQLPKDELLEIYGISSREWEVLACLSKGLSNEEIAGQLFVSANTIKTHLGNLYSKLDVKRRTQAVEKARAIGLLP